MSIELPLQYNDETPIAGLGSEFALVSSQMADRGLIMPMRTDRNKLGRAPRNKIINLSGIDMMPVAYDGLVQREDYMTFTDAQAYQQLENAVSRKPNYGVMDADGYTLGSENTDPRLVGILERESTASRDNVFSQFTQNFIRDLQQSNDQLYEEANLYYLPPGTGSSITGASVDALTPGIIAQGQEEETKRRAREEAEQGGATVVSQPSNLGSQFAGSADKAEFIRTQDSAILAAEIKKNKAAVDQLLKMADDYMIPKTVMTGIGESKPDDLSNIRRIIETIKRKAPSTVPKTAAGIAT